MAKFKIIYSDNITNVKTKDEAVKEFIDVFIKLSKNPDFAEKYLSIQEKDFK